MAAPPGAAAMAAGGPWFPGLDTVISAIMLRRIGQSWLSGRHSKK